MLCPGWHNANIYQKLLSEKTFGGKAGSFSQVMLESGAVAVFNVGVILREIPLFR